MNHMVLRPFLRTVLPAAVLVVAGVLWLQSRTDAPTVDAEAGTSPFDEDFDYFIAGMRRANFTGDGRLAHLLDAMRVVHYPADDRAELELPRFVWYADDGASSELTSLEGTLFGANSPEPDQLRLREDVTLQRPLEGGGTLVVRTTVLDADIESRQFQTDRPVTLESEDLYLESIGMHGDLQGNRLDLLNDVRGRHEPVPTQP